MFLKNRKSQAGFSLVELMVVVAIIGVLASIAVPQVNKYIAKARQSEAKTILSSIYTSEKAFYAEYSAYHGMFGAIGYSPEGKLRYNAGFSGATSAGATQGFTTAVAAPGNVLTTGAYCGAGGSFVNGCAMLSGATNVAPAAPTGAALTLSTFTAGAQAIVFGSAYDVWQIDNSKNLRNTTSGIN